jgi:hypothetical protein
MTTEDIDEAVEEIQAVIHLAQEENIREVPVNRKSITFDPITNKLVRLRNIIRRQYQRTGLRDKKICSDNLTKIIRSRVEELRNRNFSKLVSGLNSHSKPFWKLARVLKTDLNLFLPSPLMVDSY